MTDTFRISLDSDARTIRKRSHGKHPIVCPIAVHVRGVWFPQCQWDDFALTILEWWFGQVRDLDDGTVRTGKLLFMEGPYRIDIKAKRSGSWSLTCLRTDTHEIATAGNCDSEQVITEIVRAIREVLHGVRASELWTPACTNLETMLNEAYPAIPV